MQSKHYTLALIPLGIVGIALRVLQVLFGIEKGTLYFIPNAPVNTVFSVFLLVSLLFFFSSFLFLRSEHKPLTRALVNLSKTEKSFLIAFSAVTLASEVYRFYGNVLAEGATGQWLSLTTLRTVLALVMVLFFAAYASAPKTFNKDAAFQVLSLSLPVYYIVCIFDTFLTESIIRVSFRELHILLYGFLVLFSLYFTKALAGMYARRGFYAFGCCAALFSFICTGDSVAYLVMDDISSLVNSVLIVACDLMLSIAIILLLSKPVFRHHAHAKAEETAEPREDGNLYEEKEQ